MYKLLLDEPPLVVLPSLAKAIGLNEAIVLQQVHYWLVNARETKRTANFKQDRWWVFNSYEEWEATFSFWSERTIQRTFLSLEKAGLILAEQLSDDVRDRRKWYTIDYEKYQKTIEKSMVPDCHDAWCQIGMMHGAKLASSNATEWHDALRQFGADYKGTETSTETTTKTTAADNGAPVTRAELTSPDPAAADLIAALVGEGVNQADAVRLAQENPNECRRQLDYLPFAGDFTSSKGAYLRSAIEQGFAPPKAYLHEQKRRHSAQQRAQQDQQRQAQEEIQQRHKQALEQTKAHLQRDTALWTQILQEAERRLPALLQGRSRHVAYKPALEARINEIVAERAQSAAPSPRAENP